MKPKGEAIEDAMKRGFESLPPEFCVKPLDMLCVSGCPCADEMAAYLMTS